MRQQSLSRYLARLGLAILLLGHLGPRQGFAIEPLVPLAQPGRSTISWTTTAILGVCWSSPACPTVVHGTGDHGTEAVVFVLDEIFPSSEVNVGALSMAWP